MSMGVNDSINKLEVRKGSKIKTFPAHTSGNVLVDRDELRHLAEIDIISKPFDNLVRQVDYLWKVRHGVIEPRKKK